MLWPPCFTLWQRPIHLVYKCTSKIELNCFFYLTIYSTECLKFHLTKAYVVFVDPYWSVKGLCHGVTVHIDLHSLPCDYRLPVLRVLYLSYLIILIFVLWPLYLSFSTILPHRSVITVEFCDKSIVCWTTSLWFC